MDIEEQTEIRKVKNGKWYALRVVSGREKKALDNLESELKINKLTKFVGEILLPVKKEYKIKNGKKVSKDKITFPGYLLIEAVLNGEISRLIKNTNLVIEFIGDVKGKPTPLKQKEIDRIVGNIKENIKEDDDIPYIIGETVNIIDGAFKSFKGEISSIGDKNTLKVNVIIFGRMTPVELSYLQVDKI